MYNFRATSCVFVVILFTLFMIDYRYDVSWNYYLLISAVYVLILIQASLQICSGFFAPAVCRFPTNDKEIVLTFDDGPHPEFTEQVLDVLKDSGVSATFFCIGKQIGENESIVRRIRREGHEIGLHSHGHGYLYDFLPTFLVRRDLLRNRQAIIQCTEEDTMLFRPPYGVTNPAIGRVVRTENYKVIGWSIRSLDTVIKDRKKIVERVIKRIRPGQIILLHDHLPMTPGIVRDLMTYLTKEGFKIIPLREAMSKKNQQENRI